MEVMFKAEEIKKELDKLSEEEVIEILNGNGWTEVINRVMKVRSRLDIDKCSKWAKENEIKLINKWVDMHGPISSRFGLSLLATFIMSQSVGNALKKD
jgi:hypothetical protein